MASGRGRQDGEGAYLKIVSDLEIRFGGGGGGKSRWNFYISKKGAFCRCVSERASESWQMGRTEREGRTEQIDGMAQKWPEINGREDFRKYEKEGTS